MFTPRQARRIAQGIFDSEGGPAQESAISDAAATGSMDPSRGGGPSDAAFPPAHIGRFAVMREIGQGGMGVIYEARQEHPARTVAIKVLRHGLATPSALRRFEHEVEMLAHLHHPAIAHVYEAGAWDEVEPPLPYFVMEHIPHARPIAGYAQANDLSTRQRVELFIAVCEAVHHGHQRGIIHRDIKPANLLVDDEGNVKVIDFGVARATNADVALTTMRTDARELIGTLQYMSPEQCDGDPHEIGIQSDVYSLGMVLYELLCERLPYDVGDSTLAHAARTVHEAQPPRPSTVSRSLRGDLETIVLKSLEKEPARRYDSAAGLARDLRCWLVGDPIQARSPTPWLRIVRWAGRHPVAATAALCMVIVLTTIVATAVAVHYALREPYRIEVAEDHQEARLLTVADQPLYVWRSGSEYGIGDATMFRTTIAGRERRLIAIGYTSTAREGWPGALAVFDVVRSFEEPGWTRRIQTADTPPEFRERHLHAEGFSVHSVQAVDIFAEIEGDEIVAAWTHNPTSKACLRVYSLDGELLYQLWHDGPWASIHWLAGPRRFVITALSSARNWLDYGVPVGNDARDPSVVLAITPKFGGLADDFCPLEPGDAPFSPDWILWLPPFMSEHPLVGVGAIAPNPGEANEEQYFRLQYRFVELEMTFSLLFDAGGQVVPGSFLPMNSYVNFGDPHEPEEYLPRSLEELIAEYGGGHTTAPTGEAGASDEAGEPDESSALKRDE